MRVLVVGATGGLGRDVVAESLARGHQTAALAHDPSRAMFPQAVQIVLGDVLDRASMTAAVAGRDAVICAFGTPSPRQASTLLGRGSENLVEAMTEAGVHGSGLDWVLIRPPRFVSGRPRGALKMIAEGERGGLGRVVRADLARSWCG